MSHEAITTNERLKVSQGELTLEQMNLIYKYLPVDLTYTNEEGLVKFYNEPFNMIFSRSKGILNRDVRLCHLKKSRGQVEAMIQAFKKGEQDRAESYFEKKGKKIYVIYYAVRNEAGIFKGILEVAQDVTYIRTLELTDQLLFFKNTDKE